MFQLNSQADFCAYLVINFISFPSMTFMCLLLAVCSHIKLMMQDKLQIDKNVSAIVSSDPLTAIFLLVGEPCSLVWKMPL